MWGQPPRLSGGAQLGHARKEWPLEFFLPNDSRRSQRACQPRSQPATEVHIEKALHLPLKAGAVTVPPSFFHARRQVDIYIFDPHHLVQAETPVRAADAAGLHASVRSLADAKARNHIIYHHGASVDAAS